MRLQQIYAQLPDAISPRADEAARLIARAATEYKPSALASSLSAEDMVLTDLILEHALPVDIFTLDTGRLHAETLAMIDAISERWGYRVRVFRPDEGAVTEYTGRHGLNGFYGDVDLRKRCCQLRKVEPLGRALAGRESWITGQRRAQSPLRSRVEPQEYDREHHIEKFNPLADWSEDEVWTYIRARNLPYNRLHDQGYRSIGCAPCTRPVLPNEEVRAGRWWWEPREQVECGLHVTPDGRLARAHAHGETTP